MNQASHFQTAHSAKLSGLEDPDVLSMAAKENRILISHDRKTMPLHFAEFIKSEISPGLIIIPQKLPISQVAEELLTIWVTTEAAEWKNRIFSLPI